MITNLVAYNNKQHICSLAVSVGRAEVRVGWVTLSGSH